MKVQHIDDMEKFVPNNVYVIPYNKEIEVIDGPIQLIPHHQNKSSNLSIDVLFLPWLKRITKSDPNLMIEMISLYLEQTPTILSTMNQSVEEKDHTSLYKAVHKLIPSFAIMGIGADFEKMAKKLPGYAIKQEYLEEIPDDNVCVQAFEELK